MNSKTILKRTLPLAIVILVIVAVAITCSVIPSNESSAKLSDKYADTSFLTIGDVTVSSQSAYEILTKSYGSSALVETIDAYLVKNVKTPDGASTYYDKAKNDTQGLDKWISDDIFADGRAVDNLDDDATADEIQEAKDADEKTIANWYNVAMSSYNVTTVAEIKQIYVLQYAKYLYTVDYLMDSSVYTLASDAISVFNKYISFAINYADDILDFDDKAMFQFEQDAYALRDEYIAKLYELTGVKYEEAKVKSEYVNKKYKTINVENATRPTAAARTTAKWNTKADIEKVFAVKDQFLDGLCTLLNNNGAKFANTAAMVDDDDAPVITDSYKSKYEADLADEYWAIYVAFETVSERDNALAQVGVAIVNYTWVGYEAYYAELATQMAVEGTEEDAAIAAAVEATKLNADQVLEAMIKLYNNYNSTYDLTTEGQGALTQTLAIDDTKKATLNTLINTWLAKDVVNAEGKLTDEGSNFDISIYDEDGESADADLYEFLSKFHFTYSELGKVSSAFQTLISSTLGKGLAAYNVTKDTDAKFDVTKIYGPSSSANSTVVAVKFGETEKGAYGKSWADLTEAEQRAKAIEYVETTSEDSYASAKTTTAFNELRAEAGLVIYDQVYEDAYVSGYDSAFKTTDKKSKKLVAVIKGSDNYDLSLELTADDLYEKLINDHGLINVMAIFEKEYFINSEWSRLNEVYDSKKGKWLEKAAAYEEVISTPLENAQATFDYYNSYYLSYGYGTMTWEEFLQAAYSSYNVKTTDDLKMYFVYVDAEARYAKQYQEIGSYNKENNTFSYNKIYDDNANINLTSGTKTIWDVLFTNGATKSYNQIAEIDKDYFSIAGYHVLVCVKDENGNTVDPEEWTNAQKYYGDKLYAKLLGILKDSKVDERQSNIDKIVTKLNDSTAVLDFSKIAYDANGDACADGQLVITADKQNATLNAENYEYSVYKMLGLSIVCEDLSTITSSDADKYDEKFIEGIKGIYASLIKVDGVDKTQSDLSEINDAKIVSGFGYHCYITTGVNAYGKYEFTSSQISEDLEVAYSSDFLTPEIIIYLTRKAKDGEYVRIDDNLLANLDANNELNKVFANWYEGSYSYDGTFAEVVNAVRALTSTKIGKLTDPAGSDDQSYYVTAAANASDSNKRLLLAQKTYLQDLLSSYYNALISKYYTPIISDLDSTNTKYGLEYAMFLTDLSKKEFKYDTNFTLIKNINLADEKIYLLDEDGEYVLEGGAKVALEYTKRNGMTSLNFIFKYMLETITEDLTYAKELTCNLVGVEYEAEK